MSTQLPLLSFKSITIKDTPNQLNALLEKNNAAIEKILNQTDYSWDNVMQPLQSIDAALSLFWSPISHLNSVCNSKELREAYHQCIPQLTEYGVTLSQNPQLYQAIQSIAQQPQNLNPTQKKVIENNLRDFKLTGVSLDKEKQTLFKDLSQKLSTLTTQFEENVLDATQAWHYHTLDAHELAGIPDYALHTAKQGAKSKGLEGYVLTLDAPCYIAVSQYADNRQLREKIYQAYCTRASDQGPNANEFDNSAIMHEIMCLREDLAQLLDFNNYAQYSLATKMIHEPEKVLDFLWQLVDSSKSAAQKELQCLKQFAKDQLHLDNLQSWDVAYCSEKLKQQQYTISDQELRPYFTEEKVIGGLFHIVHRLFDIKIQPVEEFDSWHPDVKCYAVYHNESLISLFYFDLYARNNKRGGAWMDDAQNRYREANGSLQLPIAFVTCNFNPPAENQPALLSHDDVITLFHEFGHSLQHMLTEIDYLDVAGINGVPWDAVELCSQFLENWAWQKECVKEISSHHQTHQPIGDELFSRMQKAKNFQSAMQLQRQLELSLFDFSLHLNFDRNNPNCIQDTLNDIRGKVVTFNPPHYNRFQNGFSHIFAGGYAAGYYSYKWAEVMAADAFSLFEEQGIFDPESSQKFKSTFLASGGAREPLELFIEFRGREPGVDALLKQSGII